MRTMGLSAADIATSLTALAKQDQVIAKWRARIGDPEPRHRPQGYEALLRTLIAQQISVAAARGITAKLEGALGSLDDPRAVLNADDDLLRAGGLSRQKIGYARALADAVVSGTLDFDALTTLDDEAAITMLSAVKGFGRWSAEIYLMFAQGRLDIWPANDLGVQEGLKRLYGWDERPKERAMRELGARWQPHRSALALFCWHVYAVTAQAEKAPTG
jgi:DNA-3-methyladenine glycosylase II